MNVELLAAVLIYGGVVAAVGLWFPRKFTDLDAFFLGSRNLGPARVGFSLFASWIGAASLLVSTDEAFRGGVGAYWIIGLPAVATLLVFLPLAGPIRALGGRTISDRMEACYGRAARPAATLLIVWYMVVLAGSQMVAAGEFLKTVLGTSYLAGLGVAAGIVLAYSAAGGFVSVVRTHALQFFLLLAGAAALAFSLGLRSSWGAVSATAARAGKSGYFAFFAGADRNALVALSFVLAWTISPIAWQRIQAARTVGAARGGLAGGAVSLAVFYAGIVAAGMLFLPVFFGRPVSGPLVSEYVNLRAGSPVSGLVFVAVLAAVFSTMDAAVNAGGFSLAGDLAVRLRRDPGGRGQMALARAATLAVGAGAFLVAVRFQDILKTLGLASKIMAEGLFVPGMAALLMKRRAPLAGLVSLGAGGGYALVCFLAEAGPLAFVPVRPWPWSLPAGLALSAGGFGLGFLGDRLVARAKGREAEGRLTFGRK